MKVSDVGALVRIYRKASGISQKELAALVGISRATLNYLESGRDGEIGASKLLGLMELLGIPFEVPAAVDREHDDRVLDRVAKGAKGGGPIKAKLPRKVLVEALATGQAPEGAQGSLLAFLDEAPEETLLAAVRAVASGAGQPPKAVWKNARGLARDLGSTRELWAAADK